MGEVDRRFTTLRTAAIARQNKRPTVPIDPIDPATYATVLNLTADPADDQFRFKSDLAEIQASGHPEDV
jgi:hypothetical protein